MTQTTTWTKEEIKAFEALVDGVSSRDQVTRIGARLDMGQFIAQHGKEKCDAMFAEITAETTKKKPCR